MSDNNCNVVVEKLIESLEAEFETRPLRDGCAITTPFLYPDFASIEMYLEPVGNDLLLTDEGETLNMLFVNGLTIEKNKDLYKEAKQIARSRGAQLQNSAISIMTTPGQLGEATQSLLNAIQAISYLIYKRRNVERATFDDEVEKLLISNKVQYEPNFSIRGEANRHKVKFHVNSNRNLLVEPISAATIQGARTKAKLVAYKWLDIRPAHKMYKCISIIDDREGKWEQLWVDDEANSAIYTYSDVVIRWTTEQPKLVDLLTI
jgi:hypothetical protein